MHKLLFKLQLFCLLMFAEVNALAQPKYAGYFGKHRFSTMAVSYNPHILKTDKYIPLSSSAPAGHDLQMNHDWNFIPKFTLTTGWQKSLYRYATFEIACIQMPDLHMTGAEFQRSGAVIHYDSTKVSMRSASLQMALGFKHYSDLAPYGFYFGINYGLGITLYKYQVTDIDRDYNSNTEGFISVSKIKDPKTGFLLNPSLSARLGKTILLSHQNAIDAGIRSTFFVSTSTKKNVKQDMNEKSAIRANAAYMNQRAFMSNHLIEIYVSYTIFH